MAASPAAMKVDTRVLQSHPLLALMPGAARRKLVSESALSEYPKGTVVFREGQRCDAIYFVISGRCGSYHETDGRRPKSYEQVFGPGDSLGERELLNQEPYRTSVAVLTHSILLRIRGEDLDLLFED